jgi:thymidylate kinase
VLIVIAGLPGSGKSTIAADVIVDRVERRTRDIEGFPEPTWEGVLRRRAEFPPWTDERLTVDSLNSREANLQAALEYLSG